MSAHLARARLLLQQKRFPLAEQELGRALQEDPDSPEALALLALCRSHTGTFAESYAILKQAIARAPDWAYVFYAESVILIKFSNFPGAIHAIQQALRLDPADPDYHAILSDLLSIQEKWADALAAAERGLALNASHVDCLTARTRALTGLQKWEEARHTIAQALTTAPADASTHASQGWLALRQNRPTRAREHFLEALRLDPESAYAQEGLKAAQWECRWFNRGFRLGRLKITWAWTVLLVIFLLRALHSFIGRS